MGKTEQAHMKELTQPERTEITREYRESAASSELGKTETQETRRPQSKCRSMVRVC